MRIPRSSKTWWCRGAEGEHGADKRGIISLLCFFLCSAGIGLYIEKKIIEGLNQDFGFKLALHSALTISDDSGKPLQALSVTSGYLSAPHSRSR